MQFELVDDNPLACTDGKGHDYRPENDYKCPKCGMQLAQENGKFVGGSINISPYPPYNSGKKLKPVNEDCLYKPILVTGTYRFIDRQSTFRYVGRQKNQHGDFLYYALCDSHMNLYPFSKLEDLQRIEDYDYGKGIQDNYEPI